MNLEYSQQSYWLKVNIPLVKNDFYEKQCEMTSQQPLFLDSTCMLSVYCYYTLANMCICTYVYQLEAIRFAY